MFSSLKEAFDAGFRKDVPGVTNRSCRLIHLAGDGHHVRAIGRRASALADLASLGIETRAVALEDADAVADACANAHAVVHAAALSSPWGNAIDFHRANVTGTQHVLRAAQLRGAPGARVVHISSPSVYFRFADQFDVKEDAPFPRTTPSPYIATKRAAELLVSAAARDGLDVIGLRPRAIFGPGDSSLLPRLLRAAATGRLRVIGDGRTIADLTYIDNVVDAVLLALDAPKDFAGRFYNITNGEPVRLWDVIGELCAAHNTPVQLGTLPRALAMTIAQLMEVAARLRRGAAEPLLTRYSVAVLSYSQTLSIEAAAKDLRYEPRVGMREAIARTLPPQRS